MQTPPTKDKELIERMKQTTQQIYNKIKDIKKNGNWIESPYRHITWIPSQALSKSNNKIKELKEQNKILLEKLGLPSDLKIIRLNEHQLQKQRDDIFKEIDDTYKNLDMGKTIPIFIQRLKENINQKHKEE